MPSTPSTLLFVTGNRFKFEVAQHALRGLGISLEQVRLAVPELQSNSVKEIAEHSAQWASTQVSQPLIVHDGGFYIDALNGFPGPFIKYANGWFTVEDLLRLMEPKAYRRITVNDCLVYMRPGQPPVTFTGSYGGKVATTAGRSGGTPIERLFVPAGHETPISEFSQDERVHYWSGGKIWQEFKRYYTDTYNENDAEFITSSTQ
jgi:XTP/dITP diphosphohydrolase